MSFLLDTNICSEHLRKAAGLSHRFIQHSGRLSIPTVVLGELLAWAYRRPNPDALLLLIEELRADLRVLSYDEACAEQFGQLRGTLIRQGTAVSAVDLMIASVALVHDLTLVTHNTADFQRIPGIRLVDWLVS
jgi:tRNA(fMet)-specific endonuclease VapC